MEKLQYGQWETIKDNIIETYKAQATKIKNDWEWNAVWSYMDRLIKIQILKMHLQKAIKLNNELFKKYRKEILKWPKDK